MLSPILNYQRVDPPVVGVVRTVGIGAEGDAETGVGVVAPLEGSALTGVGVVPDAADVGDAVATVGDPDAADVGDAAAAVGVVAAAVGDAGATAGLPVHAPSSPAMIKSKVVQIVWYVRL